MATNNNILINPSRAFLEPAVFSAPQASTSPDPFCVMPRDVLVEILLLADNFAAVSQVNKLFHNAISHRIKQEYESAQKYPSIHFWLPVTNPEQSDFKIVWHYVKFFSLFRNWEFGALRTQPAHTPNGMLPSRFERLLAEKLEGYQTSLISQIFYKCNEPYLDSIAALQKWKTERTQLLARVTDLRHECIELAILNKDISSITNLEKLKIENIFIYASNRQNEININQVVEIALKCRELNTLKSLKQLQINCNSKKMSLPEIGNLVNLTELTIHDNRLEVLPSQIGKLINLYRLICIGSGLTALPAEIGNCIHLKSVALGDNQLTALPPEIGNLINMTVLNLNCNKLSNLPAEIGNLRSLEVLSISENLLSALPLEIGNLNNLVYLQAAENQLLTLPKEIGKLIQLKTLTLCNNKLREIPAEIGNLIELNHFDLSNNGLETLPPEIGNLKNLNTLDLRNNRLQTLPDEIQNLSGLSHLHLEGNLISIQEIEQLKKLLGQSCIIEY